MNDKDLRALCDKATSGPWEREGDFVVRYDDGSEVCSTETLKEVDQNYANGRFIAAAREAVPELLDRIEKLKFVAYAAHKLRASPEWSEDEYAMERLGDALDALELNEQRRNEDHE